MRVDWVGLSYRLQAWLLRRQGFRSRWIETPAGRVHLFDGPGLGSLPTVVILHGISACAAQYEPVLRRVRRWSRRVIAVDAPGHGLSDVPERWELTELQRATIAALDEVLDEPAIVYGNSMGGYGAIRFALARPERVRALALTSPGGAPMGPSALRDFVGRFLFRGARDALTFLDRLYGERRLSSVLIAHSVGRQMARVQPILEALQPEHLLTAQDLATLRAPILLQWGPKDQLLPPEHRDFFRQALPAHTFEAPDRFHHCPNLDRPGELAGRLRAWVETLEGAE